jgi:hypothetical protein
VRSPNSIVCVVMDGAMTVEHWRSKRFARFSFQSAPATMRDFCT